MRARLCSVSFLLLAASGCATVPYPLTICNVASDGDVRPVYLDCSWADGREIEIHVRPV